MAEGGRQFLGEEVQMTLLAAALVLLAGCATAYKPQGFGGGYSELQLDKNVFRVSFEGNGYTAARQAEEMALLRSAQLTLDHGYSYFVIVGSSSGGAHSTYTAPAYATTTATSYGNTTQATTVMNGGQTYLISRPSATNMIVCFEQRPAGIMSFDAHFVYDSLAARYLK